MTVALTINGTVYNYPEQDDTEWGPESTDWASAVTTGMLQKAGGLFQLLADADFGTSYGLKSLYFRSRSSNVATAGQIRLNNNSDVISYRNAANSGNLDLKVNGSDQLLFNGIPVATGSILVTDTNSINLTLATITLSADVNLSAAVASSNNQLVTLSIESDGLKAQITDARIVTGAATGSAYITNAMVSASAAIDYSKLAVLTSANILVGSGSNVATSVAVSGDLTLSNAGAATIANNAVTTVKVLNANITLAKIANIAANSFLGNNTGSPATPIELTATQATAALNVATASLNGLVTRFDPTIASSVNIVTNAAYTVLVADGYRTIEFSTGNTDRVCTLPAVASSAGRRISIVKTDTGTGKVTPTAADGSIIGASNGHLLFAQGASTELECDGSNWYVVVTSLNKSSISSTFTFDGSGGTSTARTIQFQRSSDFITIFYPEILVTSGTGSQTLTANTALPAWCIPLTASQFFYSSVNNNGNAAVGTGFVTTSTGLLKFWRDLSATAWTNSSSCGPYNGQSSTYYVGTGS